MAKIVFYSKTTFIVIAYCFFSLFDASDKFLFNFFNHLLETKHCTTI